MSGSLRIHHQHGGMAGLDQLHRGAHVTGGADHFHPGHAQHLGDGLLNAAICVDDGDAGRSLYRLLH